MFYSMNQFKYFEISSLLTTIDDCSVELCKSMAKLKGREIEYTPYLESQPSYYNKVLDVIVSNEKDKRPIILFEEIGGAYSLLGKYDFKEDANQPTWVKSPMSKIEGERALEYVINCRKRYNGTI